MLYILVHIDERRRHCAELLKAIVPVARPRHRSGPRRPGSLEQSAAPGYKGAEGAGRRRIRSTVFRRSFSRAWPRGRRRWATPARTPPNTGEAVWDAGYSHRDQRTTLARQGTTKDRAGAMPGKRTRRLRGSPPSWRLDCYYAVYRSGAFPGSETASSRPAASRERHPRNEFREEICLSRPANSFLGYIDETGGSFLMPQPEILGRNGTCIVFPQAAPARRDVPPVSESQLIKQRGGRTAGGKDDGTLAKRCAFGT